jgi:hypothetical protein
MVLATTQGVAEGSRPPSPGRGQAPLGVFHSAVARLGYSQAVLSTPACPPALSCGSGADGALGQPACGNPRRFPRGFHALFAPTLTSKAFAPPWATSSGAPCMGPGAARLRGTMTLPVLVGATGRACTAFRPLVMQAGHSFALHDAWREGLPGRFHVVTLAAVARGIRLTRDTLVPQLLAAMA